MTIFISREKTRTIIAETLPKHQERLDRCLAPVEVPEDSKTSFACAVLDRLKYKTEQAVEAASFIIFLEEVENILDSVDTIEQRDGKDDAEEVWEDYIENLQKTVITQASKANDRYTSTMSNMVHQYSYSVVAKFFNNAIYW